MTALRLFGPEALGPRAVSHAALPTPLLLGPDRLRLFMSARDMSGCSLPYAVDVSLDSLTVLEAVTEPLWEPGAVGMFDEDGIMPASAVRLPNGSTRLYYIGWNRGSPTVPYRLAIGSAISSDGLRFERESSGPVLDRSRHDPIFVTAPCVTAGAPDRPDGWSMTYVSTDSWDCVDGGTEPRYHLARAESDDGLVWHPCGTEPIDFVAEAYGRPARLDVGPAQYLAYCHRGMSGYRRRGPTAYKIALAHRDHAGGWATDVPELVVDGDAEWASEMRCYPQLVPVEDRVLMVYNGDGFGRSGVLATWLDLPELASAP